MPVNASNFNTAVSITRSAISTTVGAIYGPGAAAFANIALGHPNFLTEMAALGEKHQQQGSVTAADFATVLKIVTDIAVGTAVVAGATVSAPLAVVYAIAGITLSLYNNRDNIAKFLDDLQQARDAGVIDPGQGFDALGNSTGIGTDVNTSFTTSRGWTMPRDPLVLELI